MKIFDVLTQTVTTEYIRASSTEAVFDLDINAAIGESVLFTSDDRIVRQWDTRTANSGLTLPLQVNARSCCYSSLDCRLVATGDCAGNICIYDLRKGSTKTLAELPKLHKGDIRSLNWHPEDNTLVSGSFDHTVGEVSNFNLGNATARR